MKKKKDKLSIIIRGELICLAVVSVLVFGAVRWSENRAVPSGTGQALPTGIITPPTEPDSSQGTTAAPTEPDSPQGTTAAPTEPDSPQGTTAAPTGADSPQGVTPTVSPSENSGSMDLDFIRNLSEAQSGELLTAEGAVDTVYYMQTDPRWGSLYYGGEDTIAKYACGPTSMAIVVSSLTEIKIDPVQMSGWAYDHDYWYPQSGSLHSIINGTAKAFGLESEGVGNDAATHRLVTDALKQKDMVVVLMGKGHFTNGGHFIVLRGITEDGKILVADCNSEENTQTEWDMETLTAEAKYAADGGPFWIIHNPNTME